MEESIFGINEKELIERANMIKDTSFDRELRLNGIGHEEKNIRHVENDWKSRIIPKEEYQSWEVNREHSVPFRNVDSSSLPNTGL